MLGALNAIIVVPVQTVVRLALVPIVRAVGVAVNAVIVLIAVIVCTA